jgi:hypothetical protein
VAQSEEGGPSRIHGHIARLIALAYKLLHSRKALFAWPVKVFYARRRPRKREREIDASKIERDVWPRAGYSTIWFLIFQNRILNRFLTVKFDLKYETFFSWFDWKSFSIFAILIWLKITFWANDLIWLKIVLNNFWNTLDLVRLG